MVRAAAGAGGARRPVGRRDRRCTGGPRPGTARSWSGLRRLGRVLEHEPADLTATAEAGITLAALQERARHAGTVAPPRSAGAERVDARRHPRGQHGRAPAAGLRHRAGPGHRHPGRGGRRAAGPGGREGREERGGLRPREALHRVPRHARDHRGRDAQAPAAARSRRAPAGRRSPALGAAARAAAALAGLGARPRGGCAPGSRSPPQACGAPRGARRATPRPRCWSCSTAWRRAVRPGAGRGGRAAPGGRAPGRRRAGRGRHRARPRRRARGPPAGARARSPSRRRGSCRRTSGRTWRRPAAAARAAGIRLAAVAHAGHGLVTLILAAGRRGSPARAPRPRPRSRAAARPLGRAAATSSSSGPRSGSARSARCGILRGRPSPLMRGTQGPARPRGPPQPRALRRRDLTAGARAPRMTTSHATPRPRRPAARPGCWPSSSTAHLLQCVHCGFCLPTLPDVRGARPGAGLAARPDLPHQGPRGRARRPH